MLKKRLGLIRSNPWFLFDLLGTVGLYGITIFLTAVLLGSQSSGLMRIVFTAVGAFFEITNISVLVQALKRRAWYLWVTAVAFMCVSFCGAALGMMTSFKNATELQAQDPMEIRREALRSNITSLEAAREVELKRLASGSVEYRTDAVQTRASLASLEEKLTAAQAELSGLPPPARNEASGGYFAALPLDEATRYLFELVFRLFISALMQIGGAFGVSFLVKGVVESPAQAKKVPLTFSTKDGLIHFGHHTERQGISRTTCGRLVRPVPFSPGHVLCPDCLKLSTEAHDEKLSPTA